MNSITKRGVLAECVKYGLEAKSNFLISDRLIIQTALNLYISISENKKKTLIELEFIQFDARQNDIKKYVDKKTVLTGLKRNAQCENTN